jgi:hypothetical protein
MKSGKAGVQQQLDAIKTKIEREQTDLKAKRGKINYRSTDEVDREIKYSPFIPSPIIPFPSINLPLFRSFLLLLTVLHVVCLLHVISLDSC